MGTFDHEQEIEDLIKIIKSDIRSLDTTINHLVKEAKARPAAMSKYHELAAPLVKLMAAKHKNVDQLLKIMSSYRKSGGEDEDETEFGVSELYAKFEVEK